MKRRVAFILLIFFVVGISFYLLQNDQSYVELSSTDMPINNQKLNTPADAGEVAEAEAESPSKEVLGNDSTPLKKGIKVYYSIEDLRREFGPGWQVLKSRTDENYVKSILISETQRPRLTANNVASFVGRIRPLLGVPQAQVTLSSQEPTAGQFDLVQNIKGYEVYGGKLRVVMDSQNSTPVIINNELRVIEKFNEEIHFSARSAEDVIQREIVRGNQLLNLSVQEKPVVFNRTAKQGELSWVVHVEWTESKAMRAKDFIVSALDGAILFKRELLYH